MASVKYIDGPFPAGQRLRDRGKEGEKLALELLISKGYIKLECNYRCPRGEIDLICKDRDEIVFVEVKTRRSQSFGGPFSAVDTRKQRKISGTALYYLQEKNISDSPSRFDVVAVSLSKEETRVEHLKNAFDFSF